MQWDLDIRPIALRSERSACGTNRLMMRRDLTSTELGTRPACYTRHTAYMVERVEEALCLSFVA